MLPPLDELQHVVLLDADDLPEAQPHRVRRADVFGHRGVDLLVDEFQDTSVAQVELLKRLTEEWTSAGAPPGTARSDGEGNTLFLVGDPQQSIYGFRKAEVTLFEDARRGCAGLPSLEARGTGGELPLHGAAG